MALFSVTTRQEFQKYVLDNPKLVLIDFWASWCPPCRAIAPTLQKLAEKLDKNFDVIKVDIEDGDSNAQLASEYHVQSIPNMNICRDGKVVDTIIGLIPASQLEDRIKSHIR